MTFGFGLEKLGLVALRFPRITLLVIAVLTAALGYCASKIEFSSDIREIFRSGSPDFSNLEMVEKQYPESGADILLIIDGDLFTRENLERLRDLHVELSFAEDVKHVLSMFSARHPPDAAGDSDALFNMREVAAEDLLEPALNHPLVSGRLLSDDGKTTLIVVAIESQPDIEDLRRVATNLRAISDDALKGSDLTAQISGLAYLRLEIIGALIRDQRTFITFGFVVAWLICWLFFGSFLYAVLAGVPAVVGVIWVMGITQLRGQEVNVLTGVVPALVIVLVIANSLHLLFAIRRNLAADMPLEEAIRTAVIEVGPACILTSVTTAIALLSLTLVPQTMIVGFGLTAAIGTAMAYLATLSALPALARLLLGWQHGKANVGPDRLFRAASHLCERLGRVATARPGAILAGGIVIVACAGALYAAAEPSYRYQDYLPKESGSYSAMDRIDKRLAGTETMLLLIQWPKDYRFESPHTLEFVKKAHEILKATPLVKGVVSLHKLETWMAGGRLERDQFFAFLRDADSPLLDRIMSVDQNSTLVTAYFPGVDAKELVPVLDTLEGQLAELRASDPNARVVLTGMAALSAKASYEMIGQLNRSLFIAITLNILLIGFVFWSLRAGFYSVLPNLLPIAIAGAVLYLLGLGLQFTSVVAFTIGFGVAVDNTIHVLNYYRLIRSKGAEVDAALTETIATVGPVLMVSSLALMAGFGATLLSELPNLRLFGLTTMIVLTTALFANLLILPATIAFVEGRQNWLRRTQPS